MSVKLTTDGRVEINGRYYTPGQYVPDLTEVAARAVLHYLRAGMGEEIGGVALAEEFVATATRAGINLDVIQ